MLREKKQQDIAFTYYIYITQFILIFYFDIFLFKYPDI